MCTSGHSILGLIGGLDPTGGAGLVADGLAAAALGQPMRLVLTAQTEQDERGVRAIGAREGSAIARELGAAGDAPRVWKVGMLGCAPVVDAVADHLAGTDATLVLDPVLGASAGGALIDAAGRAAVVARLLPRAHVLTPNVPEAMALLETDDLGDLADAAHALRARGPDAVLLKGGHAEGADAVDVLATSDGTQRLALPRLRGATARGTGCTLATVLATFLVRGLPLVQAAWRAKAFVHAALAARHAQGPNARLDMRAGATEALSSLLPEE